MRVISRLSSVNQRPRRLRRSQQPEPEHRLVTRHAGLGDRRHVGQQRIALREETPSATSLPSLARPTALAIGAMKNCTRPVMVFRQRLGNALERDVHDVDLRHALEQFAGEMRAAADARRGKIELAGFGPRQREQVLAAIVTPSDGDDDQQIFGLAGQRDAGEVLARVVRQLVVDGGRDRVRGGHRQQRVAVGIGSAATVCAAMVPPAPGRLSTITGCLQLFGEFLRDDSAP